MFKLNNLIYTFDILNFISFLNMEEAILHYRKLENEYEEQDFNV